MAAGSPHSAAASVDTAADIAGERAAMDGNVLLSEALSRVPGLAERLAALGGAFEVLAASPLPTPLAGRLAGAVTLADAAAIAGLQVADFLAFVNCGRDAAARPRAEAPSAVEERPAWVANAVANAVVVARVDVRPDIAARRDPFARISSAAAALAHGEVLAIDAPFNPVPLRRVMAGRGFAVFGEKAGRDHWTVWLTRRTPPPDGAAMEDDTKPAAEAATWTDDDGCVHLDVRGLEPPQPMVAILTFIDGGQAGETLIVHHFRDPVYLYPELNERGWEAERIAGDPDEFRLRLRRSRS